MKDLNQDRAVCSCRGRIRGHGPVPPFVEGKVWGIGEAIGLVDPVTAAGIVPAMMSAKLLVDHWDYPADYEQAVMDRYSYMTKEASVLNHLMAGKSLSSGDLFFPKQALDTIGIKPSMIKLVSLVIKGARDYLGHRTEK
jgi:flavin-dependent dehydrogenase